MMKLLIALSLLVAIGNCIEWRVSYSEPEKNVCALKIEEGTGGKHLPSWGYSLEARKCVPFTYRGLRGNFNRFKSQESCEKRCSEDHMCTIKWRGGPCPPSAMAWGFDPIKKLCIKYAYGKCRNGEGGSPFVFRTKEGCEGFCSRK